MRHSDTFYPPASFSLGHYRPNLLFGDLWIDIILEVAHLFASCSIAYYPVKGDNAPRARMCNVRDEAISIHGFAGNFNYRIHNKAYSYAQPPPMGGTNTTSS